MRYWTINKSISNNQESYLLINLLASIIHRYPWLPHKITQLTIPLIIFSCVYFISYFIIFYVPIWVFFLQKDEVFLNLVLEYVPETVYRVARHYSKSKQTIPVLYIKVRCYRKYSMVFLLQEKIIHRNLATIWLSTSISTLRFVLVHLYSIPWHKNILFKWPMQTCHHFKTFWLLLSCLLRIP